VSQASSGLRRRTVAFARFWYDFVVGDDWTIALGVVVALTVAHLLADNGVSAWFVLPLMVTVGLSASVLRATHRAR